MIEAGTTVTYHGSIIEAKGLDYRVSFHHDNGHLFLEPLTHGAPRLVNVRPTSVTPLVDHAV